MYGVKDGEIKLPQFRSKSVLEPNREEIQDIEYLFEGLSGVLTPQK